MRGFHDSSNFIMRELCGEKKTMRVGDNKMKVIWLLELNNSIEDMKIIMRGLRETLWSTFWPIS